MSPEEKQRRKDETEQWLEEKFQESITPTARQVVLPLHLWEALEREAEVIRHLSTGDGQNLVLLSLVEKGTRTKRAYRA